MLSADCCHCGGMRTLQGRGDEWECCHKSGPAAFFAVFMLHVLLYHKPCMFGVYGQSVSVGGVCALMRLELNYSYVRR